MKKIHKIDRKVREEIIESMKKVINVKKDIDLARYLGIMPQTIADYKRLGIASFYKRIFDFCIEHNASINWPAADMGKMYIGAGFSPDSAAEAVCEAAIPYCTPEELKYVNMVLGVLRGVNEQDKNSLMTNIASFHQHCQERRAIDQGYLEDLKKNIQKQERGEGNIKKAQDC